MNKLFTFLASAALVGSFTACSSDEPAKGADQGTTPEDGTTMYLNVNISDANSMSRANDGGYEDGDGTEHKVETAHFFFFDKDGVFVTQASIWNADNTASDEKPNVELESNNVLVLKNLTKGNFPKYLITVLNAPSELLALFNGNAPTIDQVRNFPTQYHNGTKTENEDGTTTVSVGDFIMTTSSFMTETDGYTSTKTDSKGIIHTSRYENGIYYANLLHEDDFMKEPKETLEKDDKVIDIYVERLAAKFSTELDNAVFDVDVTIAGNNNEEITDDENVEGSVNQGSGIAATKVYVKILNFGVTGTEPTSYLSKNFDIKDALTYDATTTPWEGWNHIAYHRSYWAQSVNYNKDVTNILDYTTFSAVKGGLNEKAAVYTNETTNSVNKLQTSSTNNALRSANVTNYVFTAKVYEDKACTKELELVKFESLYYKKAQFKAYILARLAKLNQLDYYTMVKKETPTEDGGTKEETVWEPITVDMIDFVKEGAATGVFKLITNIGNDTKLYKKDSETPIENGVEKLNKSLNYLFTQGTDSNYPVAFTKGAMFYSVPVEHLLGENWGSSAKPEQRLVTSEGQFGVVRNHWYKLTVDNVFRLGQGVYDPDGSEQDKLIPNNPTPETYAMGARIKILSWKIVKQTVDL